MSNKITLANFLKKYTAIPNKFIDIYYSFYDACRTEIFGIVEDSIIKYLGLTNKTKFRERIRKTYKNGVDYLIKRSSKDISTIVHYYFSFDCFEKICIMSATKTGDQVREYFITLRKFVNYYKNHFANSINTLTNSGKYVYIMLVNKKKNIFKLGSTKDIRKRLYTYATGRDVHPDIHFIMLIKDPKIIEKCVKILASSSLYSKGKELYKIDFDALKKVTFNCAIAHDELLENSSNEEIYDSYVVYDEAINVDILDMENNVIGYEKNITSHKNTRAIKKISRRQSKNSKSGSKKINKLQSKLGSKKMSKLQSKKTRKLQKKNSKLGSKKINKLQGKKLGTKKNNNKSKSKKNSKIQS